MVNNFAEEKIGIFVISVADKIRNPNLVNQALGFWPGAKVELISALTPKSINPVLMRFLQEESSALLGRGITDFEIAVAQSHRKCYKVAIDKGYSKVLILEDDVKISHSVTISKTDLEMLNKRQNIIISLYAPKWSLWINRKGRIRAIFPPAYAAAYLINQNGLNFALSQETLGLADWPTWSSKFKFYLTSGTQFETIDSDSYLEKSRQISKKEKNKISFLLIKKYKKRNFKKIDFLRHQLIYPLIWKLLGSKSGQSRIFKFYL
jgi:GR25 family glycosyltransferase involved in LPS biosynthesis